MGGQFANCEYISNCNVLRMGLDTRGGLWPLLQAQGEISMSEKNTTLWRLTAGRWLIHIGLRVMPPGRCRTELDLLFRSWGHNVTLTTGASNGR
jgi:hypothetical protein